MTVKECPSVSGKSTLGYVVESGPGGKVLFKIVSNSGGGYFNSESVDLDAIEAALSQHAETFSSLALKTLFQGKSKNNGGFLLAVLIHEGLAEALPDGKFRFLGTGAFRKKRQQKTAS